MKEAAELLKFVSGKFGVSVVSYEGSKEVLSQDFPAQSGAAVPGGTVELAGATWSCNCVTGDAGDRSDAVDVAVTVGVTAGAAQCAGVKVRLDFADWSTDNYVLLPSAAYKGNRFGSIKMDYPPLLDDPAGFSPDTPTTITDIPRLNIGDGPSMIEQTTGDLATPAVAFHDPGRLRGFILLTEQGTRLGNMAVRVIESDDRGSCTIELASPCVRARRQVMAGTVESGETGVAWAAGDEITIRLRLVAFEAPWLQTIFDTYAAVRKDLVGEQEVRRHAIPFSAAWDLLEEKYNRDNWLEDRGFYAVGVHDFECMKWQLGWVGGGMITLPMLMHGSDETRDRAMQNLEMMLTRTSAPSGFLYGIGDGENFYSDGFYKPHPHNMHLVRKNADILYFIGKHIKFFIDRDAAWQMPPKWRETYTRLADAFVTLWRKYGQFGQFVDVETGEMQVGGTTCASIAPAGLAIAAEVLDNPEYLEVAEDAACLYYERDVANGVTNGCPGEILQAPDSESAFGLLETFVVLHEMTGKVSWLTAAVDTARQCTTWCVSYDYKFPAGCTFDRLGIQTTGAVWANVQNKHGAPGICTFSGDSLLKLFRATGDVSHLELLRDIANGLPQYLAREDRPINDARPGWMDERVNLSDWEGIERVGETFVGSCWPEASLMLTCAEVPGLYVQVDKGIACAIDSITAEIIDGCDSGQLKVRCTNSTEFPAEVKVFAETSKASAAPLGFTASAHWPMISLAAGESLDIVFDQDGAIVS